MMCQNLLEREELSNLKIFESIQKNSDENISPIKQLLNNSLSLNEKLTQLRNSISTIKFSPNGENELIKFLFDGLGGNTYIPRKGDNSERFDAVINFDDYKVVTEVEIPSSAILDAPRNLLDDYAVMHTRRGENVQEIVPLVVCWDLPNKRTDYWNVISDINTILGVKIKTISILALALYYWTDTPINFKDDSFYLDSSNTSLLCAIDLLYNNGISESDYPGYFTPFK